MTVSCRGVSAEFSGKVFDVDNRSVDRHYQPLHNIAELPHVPRPGMVAQKAHGGIGNLLRFSCVALLCLVQKVLDKYRDIVATFAQRRHSERHDVDAIVKVLAKLSCRDTFIHIAICRSHQSHIDRNRLLTAQATNFPLFKHAQ